ncbi:MAG TPA: glycosyltransferase family 2 protein [Bryobacteraceae bacterium]|nr:glycosyltransferase family 2 protein [Bryobacteraceae bacterium]
MIQKDLPPPSITVVVVNLNRRALLEACLRSLESQTSAGFETIVVDNASTDGSAEWVQSYASSAPYQIQLIRNEENRGFCGANNQGFAAARGQFIALLNNDAEAGPGWLEQLVAAFTRSPDVGMAASKILVWEDPQQIDKAGHLIWLDGQNRGRGSGEIDKGQYDAEEEVLWPDGAACMYRKAMLDEIGGFDEDLFAYGDDAELGLRARIAGWTCIYMPRAVVRHHRGTTLGLLSFRRLRLIERNRVLLAAKLFPGSLLWLNGLHYLARLVSGARAAARGKGEISRFPGWSSKIKALLALIVGDLEALTMLPRTLMKRRALSGLRKLSPGQVKQLLMRHRISLAELSESAVTPPGRRS